MSARARNRQQQAEWLAQEQRRQRIRIGAAIVAGVLFVAVLAYLVWQEAQPEARPGRDVPIQGQEHVNPGVPHDPYNTDPPTSGPHYPQPAEAGFYEEAPADEFLVHNLEHGHVIIWYNCTGLDDAACTELKENIRRTMSRAGVSAITGTLKLVAVPRPTMETRLALTSWGRIDTFDEFDAQRILDFIRAFRDRAPENNAP